MISFTWILWWLNCLPSPPLQVELGLSSLTQFTDKNITQGLVCLWRTLWIEKLKSKLPKPPLSAFLKLWATTSWWRTTLSTKTREAFSKPTTFSSLISEYSKCFLSVLEKSSFRPKSTQHLSSCTKRALSLSNKTGHWKLFSKTSSIRHTFSWATDLTIRWR